MKVNSNEIILVSACLAGVNCKFDCDIKKSEKVAQLVLKGRAIPLCPEILTGFKTPRPAMEILGGDGKDVLGGKAKIIDKNGNDYTKKFTEGAKKVLKIAKILNIKKAILKSKSPSCGKDLRFDGTFKGKMVKGDGVLTALLKKNGIEIYSETELQELKIR